MQKSRVVIDLLDRNGDFYFRLGRANFLCAGTPLGEHIHEGMVEIVLMIKGSQVYKLNGQEYGLNSGEAFITLPNELHSSGDYPEDKSLIYYIIVNLKSEALSLGYDSAETAGLCEAVYSVNRRVFPISPTLKDYCDSIIDSYYDGGQFQKTRLRNQISGFILALIAAAQKPIHPVSKADLSLVLDYIAAHICEELDMAVLADLAELSVSRFKANFREEIGIPPREYILRQKLEQAKFLLLNTSQSVTEIAYALGFSSSQYFSTVFKRFTVVSPVEFRIKK